MNNQPRKVNVRELVLAALFCALMVIGAYIRIPVSFMDYCTLQFFFVLLSGMLLRPGLAAAAMALYAALGLLGLPVFAGGGGISYVLKPTFGYILSFILASFTVSLILTKIKSEKKLLHYLSAAFAGFIITYTIGIAYKLAILNFYIGEKTTLLIAFLSCFPLEIPSDLLLSVLAAVIGKRLRRITVKQPSPAPDKGNGA